MSILLKRLRFCNGKRYVKLSFSTDLCLKKNDDNITLDEVNFLYQTASEYIEDITRWREDMNFIFEWQNNILRTSAASE